MGTGRICMNPMALVLALGASLCWGSAQVVGKLALRETGVVFFNALRFCVATTIVGVGILLSGGMGPLGNGQVLAVAVLSGVLGWFLSSILFFRAIKEEVAHRVISAGNSHPFWTIALATLFLGESFRVVLPISAGLIFFGSVLLAARRGGSLHWRKWVLVALVSAFLWGSVGVLNKHCLIAGMGVSSLLAVRLITASALFALLLIAIPGYQREQLASKRSIGFSALSGILAFPAGELMYLIALSSESASTLAPLTGTTMLFGTVLSVLLLGERLTAKSALGVGFTFFGVLLIAV